MVITLVILALSALFFMSGKVRSDLVAVCTLLALLVFQILTPEEGLAGFSNSVVVMMVGLFVVGGGIFQTGLAKMISGKILKLAGRSELKLFLLVMLATAGIGAFVSNTGTVALMLPIVVSMAAGAGMNASRLLMPLAFASSMGGMMTLIGTPPNLIIQDTLVQAGYGELSFFSFLPVGLVCVTVGTLVLLPLTKWFLSKRGESKGKAQGGKSLAQLVKEYGLSSNLFRVSVEAGSPAAGQSIASLDVRRKYGLNVLEVRRKNAAQHRFLHTVKQFSTPDTVLAAGDVVYVSGSPEQVGQWARDYRLALMDGHATEVAAGNGQASLDFYDIGIAEVLVLSSSRLINRTVKEADFRGKFNVNVLGIRRKRDGAPGGGGGEGDAGLQGAGGSGDYGVDGGDDGVRLYPRGGGDGGDDCGSADGGDGLRAERGGGVQDDKLGDHRVVRGDDADVHGAGEDGDVGVHLGRAGGGDRGLRSAGSAGGDLFHGVADDDVYQQYGDGFADGSDCVAERVAGGGKPGAVPVCGDGGGEHVFRFALFYAAERAGDAGGAIYVHGLREGGAALADYHGGGDGVRVAAAVPVLKCGNNCLSFRKISGDAWTDVRKKRLCPAWWG